MIISRPRLTRLLDDAVCRVIVLFGPAGYGKTTLAREWLATPGRSGAWLRVTPSAADIAALALRLAHLARGETGKSSGRLAQWLRSSPDPGSEVVLLSELVVDVFEGWPSDRWLVLDDYHFLTRSSAAELLVEAVVRETDIPVLITSRVRPSWATVRRVLYGEVLEVGQNVLSMTPDEAAQVLALSGQESTMQGLVLLADGWPAVIGLAALSDQAPPTEDVMPESLHDFFAEEVFREIAPSVRARIAKLALAPEVTVESARALLGRKASATLEIGVNTGFLTRVDEAYELHPLLRQFLAKKLRDLTTEDVRHGAHRLAELCLRNGQFDDAFSVGQELGSPEVLRKTLEESLDRLLFEGRLTTLRDWIGVCRRHLVPTAALEVAAAEIAFREGRWSDAELRASRAATSSESQAIASRLLRIAGQSAHLRDRLDEALNYLQLARDIAETPEQVRDALWNRFLVLGELERIDEAQTTLEEFETYQGSDLEAMVRASQAHLHLAARMGGINQAVEAQMGSLDLLDQVSDPVVTTGFLQGWATALCLAGRYREARKAAERELELATTSGLEFVVPHALGQLALARLGCRLFNSAMTAAREAGRLAERGQDLHCQMNSAVIRARIELAQGRVDRALAELEERWLREPNPGMHADFLATRALALACAGDTAEARRYVGLSESISLHVDGRVTRAFARAIAEDRTDTRTIAAFLDALETTLETENIDGFVCAYRAYPPLLRKLARVGDARSGHLIRTAQEMDSSLAKRMGIGSRLPATNGEILSPREREVLDLVRQGLSNKEISRALWITEGTAKVHVRHIFDKLGVRTRTEAALIASDELSRQRRRADAETPPPAR